MRFINFFILLTISPFTFGADSFDFKDQNIMPSLREAYLELNEKYGTCGDQEKRPLSPIKNEWLESLTELQKKIVLSEISKRAFNRCIQAETAKFNDLLVKYTIKTQNFNAINTWVELNKPYRPEDAQSVLKGLDENEIEKLSHDPELYAPFNPIKAAEAVIK